MSYLATHKEEEDKSTGRGRRGDEKHVRRGGGRGGEDRIYAGRGESGSIGTLSHVARQPRWEEPNGR